MKVEKHVLGGKWGFPFFVNPDICVSDLGITAQRMPIVYISGNGSRYDELILKSACLISLNTWRWWATLMELIKIVEIFVGTQATLHRTPLELTWCSPFIKSSSVLLYLAQYNLRDKSYKPIHLLLDQLRWTGFLIAVVRNDFFFFF